MNKGISYVFQQPAPLVSIDLASWTGTPVDVQVKSEELCQITNSVQTAEMTRIGAPRGKGVRSTGKELTSASDSREVTKRLIINALFEALSVEEIRQVEASIDLDVVSDQAAEDLEALCAKDPATHRDYLYTGHSYTAFAATYHYRRAHAIGMSDIALRPSQKGQVCGEISRRGKLQFGAELHYLASIGKRFVLDHGFGTVVGETTSLGDDCYLLGGITLGARGISENPQGIRHPQIGSRVQIGGFANLFGCISIGNDVFIGPNCAITKSIESGAVVSSKSELNISRSSAAPSASVAHLGQPRGVK